MTIAESPVTAVSTPLERVAETILFVVGDTDSPIVPEASLGADLGIDSMSVVEILVQVEKRFGFQLQDAEVTTIATVQDVLDAVLRRQ
ncbi:acyl carrier protein [Streptomyces sp. NPDC017936]|uniref:acyl carrier protein n=1 Tax=Streptomyces sp. NPDC017936 TaxID=3365016 RepID=UPI0037B34536